MDAAEHSGSRAASVAAGEEARRRVPLDSHADFAPAASRDAIALLRAQDEVRVPWLVPIRHKRMSESAFAFFRGAALPMAADLATTPSSGLVAQLCGDAHLSNFGAYGSPERRLVFDINDFDETLPGPFEWDLKRLVASMVVAGRAHGFTGKERRKIALRTARSYRKAMTDFARMPALEVWYARLDVDDAVATVEHSLSKKARKRVEAQMAKARSRDGLQALSKLTTVVDGRRRIISDPPLVIPLEDLTAGASPEDVYAFVREVVAQYALTLSPERRHLVEQFTLAGVAHKVVGVGSVGMRAWIVLLEPQDGLEPLLLQAKEAGRSVLAGYLGESPFDNQGERVVVGQRAMQAASDVLLGWQRAGLTSEDPRDYVVRQLRDWKYSVDIGLLDAPAFAQYGRLCAWTLARAHARSGDRIAIATYVGESEELDQALAAFAETYADQTDADHRAHLAAIADGTVPTEVIPEASAADGPIGA